MVQTQRGYLYPVLHRANSSKLCSGFMGLQLRAEFGLWTYNVVLGMNRDGISQTIQEHESYWKAMVSESICQSGAFENPLLIFWESLCQFFIQAGV